MPSLKLNDPGTRRALLTHGLTPSRRIGRGQFCVVFDDGPDSVLKLTSDPIQVESVRDYLGGRHFPVLKENFGYVGEQLAGDMTLMLYKAERLTPLATADVATKRLARQVLKKADQFWYGTAALNKSNVRGSCATKRSIRSQVVAEQLTEDQSLPESIREAFQDLLRMMWNYDDLSLDFKGTNLMVRNNEELVLNDVILDGRLMHD